MKIILTFLLITLLLSACQIGPSTPIVGPVSPDEPVTSDEPGTGLPASRSYQPQPGDTGLTRGAAFVDSSDLLILESYPVQIMLTLKGSLPTPCNQLRVATNPPDPKNQIQVEVYSVIEPDQMCAEVLESFDVNVGLGSFPSGHYSVWVNGEMVGEFDS